MHYLIEYTGFATFILFAVGAFRILLFGEHYKISLWSYIGFSNLLAYTFDIFRGLLVYYGAIAIALAIFQNWLLKWFLEYAVVKLAIGIIFLAGIIVFTIIYWGRKYKMTLRNSRIVTYALLTCTLTAGLFLYLVSQWAPHGLAIIKDFEIVRVCLVLFFIFIYVKITFKHALWYTNSRKTVSTSKIVCKELQGTCDTICTNSVLYVILSTSDFVFIYNETEKSVKAIATSNIVCITTNIT